jgi:hypothetical protein
MKIFGSLRIMLMALLFSLIPASSFAGIFISVGFAPPILPVYEQPVCPEPGLMWSPGYWAYGGDGYYWVPGTWVPAPYEGALWTPPYWGWQGGLYVFHDGYWGPHVGYYGGVNYGFGYMGIGFVGGEWRGGAFAYNTAVVRVNTTVITNTYVDRNVVVRNTIVNDNHVAFSGGPGGINHPPAPEERVAERDQHVGATSFQQTHVNAAMSDRSSYVSNNGGHPNNLAVQRPLTGGAQGTPGVERSKSASDSWSSPTRVQQPANGGAANEGRGNYNNNAPNAGSPESKTYNASHSNTANPAPSTYNSSHSNTGNAPVHPAPEAHGPPPPTHAQPQKSPPPKSNPKDEHGH